MKLLISVFQVCYNTLEAFSLTLQYLVHPFKTVQTTLAHFQVLRKSLHLFS